MSKTPPHPLRARTVEQYAGRHREFIQFLHGWIGAAGHGDGMESDECAEIADTIKEVLEREFSGNET